MTVQELINVLIQIQNKDFDVMFYDTFTEELCNIQYIEVADDFITLVGS